MKKTKPVYLGADHGGFAYKEHIRGLLEKKGIPYVDIGTFDEKPVDYPWYAKEVAKKVVKEDALGFLVCGTGTGMSIAADKVKGARAAVVYDEYSATMARKDNDAQIACLRGRKFPKTRIKVIVESFLSTKPSKAKRHVRRREEASR